MRRTLLVLVLGGVTYHAHAVNVGGRWTWIRGEPFLSALSRGRCLDGSRLLKSP